MRQSSGSSGSNKWLIRRANRWLICRCRRRRCEKRGLPFARVAQTMRVAVSSLLNSKQSTNQRYHYHHQQQQRVQREKHEPGRAERAKQTGVAHQSRAAAAAAAAAPRQPPDEPTWPAAAALNQYHCLLLVQAASQQQHCLLLHQFNGATGSSGRAADLPPSAQQQHQQPVAFGPPGSRDTDGQRNVVACGRACLRTLRGPRAREAWSKRPCGARAAAG